MPTYAGGGGGGGGAAAVQPQFAERFDSNLSAYTLHANGVSLSVSSGRLRQGAAGGAPGQQSRLTRTGVLVPDSKQMIVGYIMSPGYQFGLLAKALDADNYLRAMLYNENNAGTNSVIQLAKFDAGVGTQLAVSSNTGMLKAGDVVSLVLSMVSNQVTLALYFGHPSLNAAPKATLSHTLAGADATKFGTGVNGGVGIYLNDYATDNSYDDHVCVTDVAAATF